MKDILRYFPGKIQNILNEEIGEKYNILEFKNQLF